MKDVKVKANIPTLAGTMGRIKWEFRVVDEKTLPYEYLKADEVPIGAMVRRVKDKKKAEALCPGIEVWSKDAV